ncbi:hypothetical protein MHBO_003419 [Bonamia ostreae]|uniref:RRM domain-containing protein n=1 Tax=Bonamia ostreae TaxID=126728 RepID=A0ABV2AQD6_9EUKA
MLENKISQKNQNSENKNLNKNGQDHTVFVVNLDHSSKDKEISQLFSQFGKIKRIKIPKKNDGSVKGYGYVTYKNTESAENAIKKLNLAKFKNGILNVQRSRNDQISKRTLFVKNLPKKDCEKELKALFGNFGEIEEIRRPQERSKNGGMKPFCYITFKNILSLEKALKNPKDDFRVKLGKVEKVIKIEKCEALGTQTRIYKERNMSKLTQKTKKLQIPVSVQIKRKKTLKLQNLKNGKNLNENVNLNENLSNEQFSQILNK